jgi:hypothetical protein
MVPYNDFKKGLPPENSRDAFVVNRPPNRDDCGIQIVPFVLLGALLKRIVDVCGGAVDEFDSLW